MASKYRIDDFDEFDGERQVFELDISNYKPYIRRLWLTEEELTKYLSSDNGELIFPTEELAKEHWQDAEDICRRRSGLPTKLELQNISGNENFKRWFGNSVVKNSDGSPKIVYHGTGAEFEEFRDCGYIFLASTPTMATDYAYAFYDSVFRTNPIRTQRKFKEHNNETFDVDKGIFPGHIEVKRKYNMSTGEYCTYLVNKETHMSMKLTRYTKDDEIREFIDSSKSRGGVHPLFCRIEKPYIINAHGRPWDNLDGSGKGKIAEDYIKEAKNEGCDGLILYNVNDGHGRTETQYVPFSPNQVKQVYNSGSFSNDINNFWENKKINVKKTMIRLTESDLHRIVKETVDMVMANLNRPRREEPQPEVKDEPQDRVYSVNELQWMYDNQDKLDKTQIMVLNAAMWVRARRANYYGLAKEWPNIILRDGKTYYYEKYGQLRKTGT